MSRGRRPAYIYDCACGGVDNVDGEGPEPNGHPAAPHFAINVARYITNDELAQLLAHLTAVEVSELCARGCQLADEIRQSGNSDPGRPA
jgi:hypothetical protein